MNPVPFILAIVFGLIAFLCGGITAVIVTEIVWLSIVAFATMLQQQ